MKGTDLEAMVGHNETILWRGKPLKKCFILESIFNPMLIFALIWAFVDVGVIGGIVMTGIGTGGMIPFLLFFFAIHMMPVWLYLVGVFFSFRKYRNTEYIVTDKGIYVSGGVFSYTNEMKPFTDLSHVNIHRGIFDQWLGVGDVVTVCAHSNFGTNSRHGSHSSSHGLSICDIADYQKVFSMIKELQTDIYSDTMYPNDLRPGANHGYQTEYAKKDRWQ